MQIEIENYYQILQLNYPSNQEAIKLAYKRLAKELHPDKNVNSVDFAKGKFEQVNFAYQVLGNEYEKENYDFLYHKYLLKVPYLNSESGCSSGCCSTTAAIGTDAAISSKKRIILYAFGLILILAIACRFVLKGLDFLS